MVYYQVYFFNLTNPEAVFEGTEKPKLVEVSYLLPHEKYNLRTSLVAGWPLHIQTTMVKTECHLARQWNDFLQDEKSVHIYTFGVVRVLLRRRAIT